MHALWIALCLAHMIRSTTSSRINKHKEAAHPLLIVWNTAIVDISPVVMELSW